MKFEWNSDKASSNLSKHGITFEEATTIFGDPLSLTIPDPLHSEKEDRYVTIGLSVNFRTLAVVHADCGETIRIISARIATRNEKLKYEEGI